MTHSLYRVLDLSGHVSPPFDWNEAETQARDMSIGSIRLIQDESGIVAIFHDGKRYIPATGRLCEQCQCQLTEDQAHYSYELTGHFFCSAKCGVALGILMVRPHELEGQSA